MIVTRKQLHQPQVKLSSRVDCIVWNVLYKNNIFYIKLPINKQLFFIVFSWYKLFVIKAGISLKNKIK